MDIHRAYAFIGTLNNYLAYGVDDPEEFIRDWVDMHGATYANGQVEQGENGTVHVQFYVHFKVQKTVRALSKVFKHAHYTPVHRDNGASDYALKEETRINGPWEFGVKPLKRNDKKDWDQIRRAAQAGDWEAIPSDVYIRYFSNLKKINVENLKPESKDDVRGVWIYGPPGVGKTHNARTMFGDDIYIKPQNKWWDGYTGQKIVVLDDLDTDVLSHYLKIWSDKWSCTGEIKGGTVALTYDKFIVTSNFSIENLHIRAAPTTVAALKRRFIEIHQTVRSDEEVKREA